MTKTAIKSIFIALLTIATFAHNANAGYVIKSTKTTNANITQSTTTDNNTEIISTSALSSIHNKSKNQSVVEENENQRSRNKKRSTSGWEGTASLYCAIFGLLVFPPGLIAAIILGAIGLGEAKKHRGRAIAGLIIGITSIFLIATLIVLLTA
jgi:hypothetical protein